VQLHPASVDPGDVEELAEQAGDPVRVRVDRGQHGPLLLVGEPVPPGEQGPGEPLDAGQRRADLVGHRGDHVAADPIEGFAAAGVPCGEDQLVVVPAAGDGDGTTAARALPELQDAFGEAVADPGPVADELAADPGVVPQVERVTERLADHVRGRPSSSVARSLTARIVPSGPTTTTASGRRSYGDVSVTRALSCRSWTNPTHRRAVDVERGSRGRRRREQRQPRPPR
jgi:hypothetical protein